MQSPLRLEYLGRPSSPQLQFIAQASHPPEQLLASELWRTKGRRWRGLCLHQPVTQEWETPLDLIPYPPTPHHSSHLLHSRGCLVRADSPLPASFDFALLGVGG